MSPTQEREQNILEMAEEAKGIAYEIGFNHAQEGGSIPQNTVSFEAVMADGRSRRFNILFKSTVDAHGLKSRFMAGYRAGCQ